MSISTNEFIQFVEKSLKSGLITNADKENYFYECALTQATNGNIQKLMKKIMNEINKINKASS